MTVSRAVRTNFAAKWRGANGSVSVAADFTPIFIFPADFDAHTRSVVIVISSPVLLEIWSSIVALHLPVATHRTMIQVVFVVRPPHTPLAEPVAIALPRSPIATDPDILSRRPFLVSKLLRLFGPALRLHRS